MWKSSDASRIAAWRANSIAFRVPLPQLFAEQCRPFVPANFDTSRLVVNLGSRQIRYDSMNLHDWLPEVSLTRVDCFSGSLITHLDSQRESQRESSPGVSTIDTESADEEWVPGADTDTASGENSGAEDSSASGTAFAFNEQEDRPNSSLSSHPSADWPLDSDPLYSSIESGEDLSVSDIEALAPSSVRSNPSSPTDNVSDYVEVDLDDLHPSALAAIEQVPHIPRYVSEVAVYPRVDPEWMREFESTSWLNLDHRCQCPSTDGITDLGSYYYNKDICPFRQPLFWFSFEPKVVLSENRVDQIATLRMMDQYPHICSFIKRMHRVVYEHNSVQSGLFLTGLQYYPSPILFVKFDLFMRTRSLPTGFRFQDQYDLHLELDNYNRMQRNFEGILKDQSSIFREYAKREKKRLKELRALENKENKLPRNLRI